MTAERTRKSLSSERTFQEDVKELPALVPVMRGMLERLVEDLAGKHADRVVRSLVVKLKFADFKQTTAERAWHVPDPGVFEELLGEAWGRGKGRAVRLLGVGVRFADPETGGQLEFFE